MSRRLFLLLIPIGLSALTHIWNPIGFPSIHHDEDTHYLPRTLIFMNGGGPEQYPKMYDHPYFGQIFLAGIFKLIGYPSPLLDLNVSNLMTIQFLYMVPRILMGLLATFDTFLLYKISEIYSDRKVAFIASVLFAVMPVTWIFRQVFLDNIFLPFILCSIFLAIRTRKKHIHNQSEFFLVLISGILLGLAIFTKIPAITLIPLVGFLIYSKNSSLKRLGIWFIPVILIPLIWPAYALSTNGFDEWIQGVIWQSTGRINQPLSDAMYRFFLIDPVLLVLGIGGLIYVALKRENFLLLWIIPFFIFSLVIEFVSFFHLVLVIPAICIAASRLLRDLGKITAKRENEKLITIIAFIVITIFGIMSTTILISISASTSYFQAISFTNKYIPQIPNQKDSEKVTVIGPPSYFWVPKYVYGKNENYYKSWWEPDILNNNTTKILFIIPNGVMTERMAENNAQGKKLQAIYNSTHVVATFERNENSVLHTTAYPFTSTKESPLSGKIEIRSNY